MRTGLAGALLVTMIFSVIAGGPTIAAPSPVVTLTVEERAGVERRAEPIVAGVPLPKGRVKEVAALALRDEQQRTVPAAITAVNRWWEDGTLKWVHLRFFVDVPAHGKRELTVVEGAVGDASPPRLQVAEDADRITVTT